MWHRINTQRRHAIDEKLATMASTFATGFQPCLSARHRSLSVLHSLSSANTNHTKTCWCLYVQPFLSFKKTTVRATGRRKTNPAVSSQLRRKCNAHIQFPLQSDNLPVLCIWAGGNRTSAQTMQPDVGFAYRDSIGSIELRCERE